PRRFARCGSRSPCRRAGSRPRGPTRAPARCPALRRAARPRARARVSARRLGAPGPGLAPSERSLTRSRRRDERGLTGRSANREGVSGGPAARAALVVGALGVVFGDIGTSPLYTMQTIFNPGDPHPVAVSRESVFGVVSLVFWAVTIVVTVTYVLLVMRA